MTSPLWLNGDAELCIYVMTETFKDYIAVNHVNQSIIRLGCEILNPGAKKK